MLALLLPLALAFAFACGDDAASDATPTSPPSPSSGAAASTARPQANGTPRPLVQDDSLRDALLADADLGDGWVAVDLSGGTLATTVICGDTIDLAGATAIAAWSNDGMGAFVFSGVVRGGPGAAAAYLSRLRSVAPDCHEMTSTDGATRTDYEFAPWPGIHHGEESVAWLLHPVGADSRGYMVTMRRGESAANLLVIWSGEPDESEARRLAAAADARLDAFVRQPVAP